MISAYNAATQTVANGAAYVFDTNRVVTGCTVGHTAGTTTFTLNKPGYYYVSFNTTFTTEARASLLLNYKMEEQLFLVPSAQRQLPLPATKNLSLSPP